MNDNNYKTVVHVLMIYAIKANMFNNRYWDVQVYGKYIV